jgi:hypothetical protein
MNRDEISDRIGKLERQNRALTRVLAAVLLVGCLAALPRKAVQSPLPDGNYRIVRASKFEVVDPRTGLVRATLDHQVAPGGWAALHFFDSRGRPRAWLRLFEDGEADLSLLDREGVIQCQLGLDAQGHASSSINRSVPYNYGEEMKRKGVKLDYRAE